MSRRKTISVHDYPEHLNPFSEIHQHQPQYEPEPFKFHTMGRPKRRASISNAWNMFASRKTKPVEASLNLSPRLPRTSSLANNELQEPPPPARRKLFSDFSWLPGRRRFGSVSQQSSPSTPRRNKTPYPEETTAQRYRSISLTRTSETTVYRPGETPLITPRTHRYRSPSLIPSDHDPYRTISGYPAVNGGDYRYPHERRNRSSSERLNVEEIPRRTRSSSLSPTANGGPYSTRLYIDEPPSRTSTQGLERLYIEEPADRQRSSVTVHRRLYGEESPKKTPNGDQHDVQDSPRNRPSSVSPTSSGGRQSPAVTPSHGIGHHRVPTAADRLRGEINFFRKLNERFRGTVEGYRQHSKTYRTRSGSYRAECCRQADSHLRSAAEYCRTADEHLRAAVTDCRAADEHLRAADECCRTADEHVRAALECYRSAVRTG
ncbi:serine/arginine repetitive matrix protein 2 isoform X2 [Anabrus simplex]|uniref:serine/arginine repetitive matrix protein 2 isoform X2 n=1 Tax=Anabrus simplex TaxID=316456 RepID=UPI0035A2B3DE